MRQSRFLLFILLLVVIKMEEDRHAILKQIDSILKQKGIKNDIAAFQQVIAQIEKLNDDSAVYALLVYLFGYIFQLSIEENEVLLPAFQTIKRIVNADISRREEQKFLLKQNKQLLNDLRVIQMPAVKKKNFNQAIECGFDRLRKQELEQLEDLNNMALGSPVEEVAKTKREEFVDQG